MPELNIRNFKMHYREWGSGGNTTILVLHGWGAASSQYETLGSLLEKKGFHVIVPDLPGWGSTPPPPCPWDVEDYMNWVGDFISALKLEKFVLFGHSFGGRVSIKYSAKYPEKIQALILCSSAGIKPTLTIRRRITEGLAIVGRILFGFPCLNKFAPFAREVLYGLAGVKDYLRAEGVMKKTIIKVLKEDLASLLASIHMPTLLLWGDLDMATPLKDGCLMEKLIPNAKLVIFKNARHNLPKLIPEKLAIEIINFLK